MLKSQAVVEIERPARYAKQVASHLGHKINVTEIEGGHHYALENAAADVLPNDTHLVLNCEGEDAEALERVQWVLQKHIVKFAGDLNPEFVWVPQS